MQISKDSILHDWTESLILTEIPYSYQVLAGMSMVGSMLGRRVWFDDIDWKTYCNLSVLLVGPSGIGKDTIINICINVIDQVGIPAIVGGRTIEVIYDQLLALGDPAVAFVPAGELVNFLGNKDYQSGKAQELTDLLSTNAYMDVRTKSKPDAIIKNPTISMIAGSTPKWLHVGMPEGAIEGGFLPRFVIISEKYGQQHRPWPKFINNNKDEANYVKNKRKEFVTRLRTILKELPTTVEMFPLGNARENFYRWYIDRFEKFSPLVIEYANRARGQATKLAMISAVCRGRDRIDEQDVKLALDIMSYVGERIDSAAVPPTRERECANALRAELPAYMNYLMKQLSKKFELRTIKAALELLQAGKEIEILTDGKVVEK